MTTPGIRDALAQDEIRRVLYGSGAPMTFQGRDPEPQKPARGEKPKTVTRPGDHRAPAHRISGVRTR